MKALHCAVIALSLSTLSAAAQDADTFNSATAGFTLKKAAGWKFVTNAPVTAEELRKAYDQPATVSLVTLAREESFGNFGVTLIPRRKNLEKATPKQILEFLVLPSLSKQFPDFQLASLQDAKLAGRDAAEYVATYTVLSSVGSMPVRVRALLVPRGQFFFLIDMTAPVRRYEEFDKELASMVSSITIAP